MVPYPPTLGGFIKLIYMSAAPEFQYILDLLPHTNPFRFADEILHVDSKSISGTYTYPPDASFYEGHFPDEPITPGVLLIETMAQIGLVALGIYLTTSEHNKVISVDKVSMAFTSAEVEFLKPVLPGEKVIVHSEKIYFRLKKLKCKVKMLRPEGEEICKGILSGMIISRRSYG